jgi:RNA polymerase sigma factor (sigma-70 family)
MNRPQEFDARLVAYLPYIKRLAAQYVNAEWREDVAQETVERCLLNWRKFRPGAAFAPWVRFQMMDACTVRKKRRATERKHAIHAPEEAYHAPRTEEVIDARRIITVAVTDRDWPILARVAMGDSLAEAGRSLGITREYARQRAERGRAALRAQFGEAA